MVAEASRCERARRLVRRSWPCPWQPGAVAGRESKGPAREVVTASLQQEANTLKADGEKLDPVLRVKATWNIEGLDISERPNDPDRPWAGTIRFKIRSETQDTDGKVV